MFCVACSPCPDEIFGLCCLFCLFVLFTGHGEQEDLNGHDAEGGAWPAQPTVYLPHPTEHEVTHCLICLFFKALIG